MFRRRGKFIHGSLDWTYWANASKPLCRSEFFVTRSVFRIFTAIFGNAMLLGGARTPTTCSIESSYRFWCFVYISNHSMPYLCLGAIFKSAQFRRLVFLRFIVVFLNDNHTNFQCHVFHGTIVRKYCFVLRRDTLETEPWLPSTALQSGLRNGVLFSLPNKFHFFGYGEKIDEFSGHTRAFRTSSGNFTRWGLWDSLPEWFAPANVCWAESRIHITGWRFDESDTTFWWSHFSVPEIPTTFEWVVTVRIFARWTAVGNGQEPFS